MDAIEALFVPVLVRNNVSGREREVLERFGEPTWANPSLRVVDPAREETLARLAGDDSRRGLLNVAAEGLRKAGRQVPPWLELHTGSGRAETATYAMACFWAGEARLGGLDGVIATRTGWRGGSEVVEVTFDPARISREALTAKADAFACRRYDGGGALRPTPKDDKHQLRGGPLRFLPMTPTQASRANARLGRGIEPILSPRQRALWAAILERPQAGWPVALGQPFPQAFAAASRVAGRRTR